MVWPLFLYRPNVAIHDKTSTFPSARMSPGPWWGFNGVDRLELRPGFLIHSHYILFHGYMSRVYDFDQVQVESAQEKQRRGKRIIALRLRLNDRSHRFTGWAEDAAPLVQALQTSR